MPGLFIFLLKVNAALLLFCLGYYLVLRRLTFYTLNRIYLVAAIIFSTIYPIINLDDFAMRHQQLTRPVENIILNWKVPAANLVKPLDRPNYWQFAEAAFWIGVALFALRLAVRLLSLYRLYRNSKPSRLIDHDVRLINGDASPFSFWQTIYINPDKLEPADLKNVLQHEQIHVNEWHTLDILLAELSTVFYWFNPGVWLIKNAIRENIEFITDRKILLKGADTRQYQYSLLNISYAASQNTIVNHFNISTIKKRIIMMNAKRSSRFTLTRYAFVLPAVITLPLLFSFSENSMATKSSTVFQNMVTAVSSINAPATASSGTAMPAPSATGTTSSVKNIASDTVYNGKGKNSQFTVVSDKSDSVLYVINGVKSTQKELRAINPDQIESINLIQADDAKRVYDQTDGKRQVCFVTTKGSAAGKQFLEKMNKTLGYDDIRSGVSVGGIQSSDNVKSYRVVTTTASGDGDALIDTIKAPGVIVLSGSAKPLAVSKNKNLIIVSAAPKIITDTYVNTNMAPGNDTSKKLKLSYSYNYHYSGSGKDTMYLKKAPYYAINTINVFSNKTIDHMSDKLILIDGQEATAKDMKKLKAYDIESISVKNDPRTKSQYGDKAKNGVLFITTKK